MWDYFGKFPSSPPKDDANKAAAAAAGEESKKSIGLLSLRSSRNASSTSLHIIQDSTTTKGSSKIPPGLMATPRVEYSSISGSEGAAGWQACTADDMLQYTPDPKFDEDAKARGIDISRITDRLYVMSACVNPGPPPSPTPSSSSAASTDGISELAGGRMLATACSTTTFVSRPAAAFSGTTNTRMAQHNYVPGRAATTATKGRGANVLAVNQATAEVSRSQNNVYAVSDFLDEKYVRFLREG